MEVKSVPVPYYEGPEGKARLERFLAYDRAHDEFVREMLTPEAYARLGTEVVALENAILWGEE